MAPWLIWFLAGIGCFGIELILPGFIVFFFGLGAWSVALVVYFFTLSLSSQLLLFLAASLVTLLLLRGWLSSTFLGGRREEDDSVNVVPVGATAVVTRAIEPPARGQVRFGGSFWNAEADRAIATGAVVRVVEQKDLLLRVEPTGKEEN